MINDKAAMLRGSTRYLVATLGYLQ